jgi:heme/copper-type cytochrome/quinol oxidase subunit 3
MPIILINKHNGQQAAVQGEDVHGLFATARNGLVDVVWIALFSTLYLL